MRLTSFIILFLTTLSVQAQAVNDLKKPVITGTIDGESSVCLTVPYTYSITENDAKAIYVWQVSNGEVIGSNTGKEIDVVFSKPDATVSVVKQYIKMV